MATSEWPNIHLIFDDVSLKTRNRNVKMFSEGSNLCSLIMGNESLVL